MYKITLETKEGLKNIEIDDIKDIAKALAPYEGKYISCNAIQCDGEAQPIEPIKPKKYDTTTHITYFNVDWMRIKSACMTTISKQAGKEPNDLWKKKLLICRHSPIRRGEVSWKWDHIPYAISTHFARHHEGCEKFVGTERTDRTGVDRETRSQMNYVPMEMDANIQALLNISEKRLCMCADPTTREYWQAVIEEIRKYDELVAWANVPQCVRCGGCVEPFSNCHYYENLMKDISLEDQMDVMKRYDIYNEKVKTLSLKR